MTVDPPERSDDDLESLRPRCDEFYRERSISAYFNTRLAVLAAVNEHREQFVAWANEGVNFHDIHIAIPSVETDDNTSDPPSANSDLLQWYVQTETASLQMGWAYPRKTSGQDPPFPSLVAVFGMRGGFPRPSDLSR